MFKPASHFRSSFLSCCKRLMKDISHPLLSDNEPCNLYEQWLKELKLAPFTKSHCDENLIHPLHMFPRQHQCDTFLLIYRQHPLKVHSISVYLIIELCLYRMICSAHSPIECCIVDFQQTWFGIAIGIIAKYWSRLIVQPIQIQFDFWQFMPKGWTNKWL